MISTAAVKITKRNNQNKRTNDMKKFKEFTEELFNEGAESYPADDMTIKELQIACYSALNILDLLQSGAPVQRWQISAIVKAKEELSSVYASIAAEEEEYDDEWEDEYDEEPMYVGFEYPSMYEAVDKDHPIVKEYHALKKRDIKELRGMIAQQSRISDTSEFKTKDHAASHILRSKHGHKKVADAFGLKEEADLEEGYNDPIHRKYISDTVHDYVAKNDPKHEKIVDHLHKAKNFGSKTVDSLSDHAGISLGAANAITKEVASNLKANFGTPQKTQTQAQRVGAYLKQKHIRPRSK